jgi:transposase
VDELNAQIAACEAELRAAGADHPYVPLLMTVPGIAWVLGYTIAAEIGDIGRFATPKKLAGYTGLCPIVRQSGRRDDRGSLAKNGPKYLRWALIEAATHAARHPANHERYEHTKKRLGRQRGAKVARVEIARELATADLAHVDQERAVRSRQVPRRASGPFDDPRLRWTAGHPIQPGPPDEEAIER